MEVGWLPQCNSMAWLAPPRKDGVPRPLLWNLVVHVAFIHRGLCFPLSSFVRGILTHYGLQLHHLTPSGVLHLSCFVTLCECFLGIFPHFDLFRYFFKVVPRLKEGKVPSCGGAIICPRPDSNYFELPTAAEPESWVGMVLRLRLPRRLP